MSLQRRLAKVEQKLQALPLPKDPNKAWLDAWLSSLTVDELRELLARIKAQPGDGDALSRSSERGSV